MSSSIYDVTTSELLHVYTNTGISHLVAKFVLNVTLDTTKHEWLKDHVEPTQLVLVQLATLVLSSVLDILREPLVELIMGVKKTRHDEVKQCPELCSCRQLCIYSSRGARYRPCIEFWMGVPVNNRRFRHWKPSSVFQRALDEFLMF